MDETILTYIEKVGCYLILYRNKKENDLNEGKWLGIGGHIESGETRDMAMIREVKEETNLDVLSYKYRGKVLFTADDYQEIMYLFTVDSFKGEIGDCNEGTLQFVPKTDIFSLNMWEGDKYFLEALANDEDEFEMELTYKNDKLVSYRRIK